VLTVVPPDAAADVVQAVPLARAMAGTMMADPLVSPRILWHVGPRAFLGW
jgi:hypothetical protein